MTNTKMPPESWFENDPDARKMWEQLYATIDFEHLKINPNGDAHILRVISYYTHDGYLDPAGDPVEIKSFFGTYIEVEERHKGRTWLYRFVEINTLIHATINMGSMEIFQIGNREVAHDGTPTPP